MESPKIFDKIIGLKNIKQIKYWRLGMKLLDGTTRANKVH